MTSKKKLKRKLREVGIRARWWKNYAGYWRETANDLRDECRNAYSDLHEYMNFVRPDLATRADDDRLEAQLESEAKSDGVLNCKCGNVIHMNILPLGGETTCPKCHRSYLVSPSGYLIGFEEPKS